MQSSRRAWELVHFEDQSLRDEIRFAQSLQSEHEECEAYAHYQRHHHIPIVVDELQSQGLPREMRQHFAARGIPLCVECNNLQRQLLWAEIDSANLQKTAKAAFDEEHTDQSDSSVHNGGLESKSDFYHGAFLRAEIIHPDALMRPGGIIRHHHEQPDEKKNLEYNEVPHHMWTF